MKNAVRAVLGFLLLLVFSSEPAFARYLIPDLQQVPVERLSANVQKKIEAEPNAVQWRYTLARLYSMAYAKRTKSWRTPSSSSRYLSEDNGVPYFYPGEDGGLPQSPKKEALYFSDSEIQSYLDRAIEAYQETLRLDPTHLYSQLGLAWCLKEKGRKDEAIAAYRKAHQQAWEQAEKLDYREGNNIAGEAGTELLDLLPKEGAEAKKERAEIQKRIEIIEKKPIVISPILVPLEDVGLSSLIAPGETAGPKGTWFNLDGFGAAYWQWITPKAGLLVWDPDQTGTITSGRQLFGNVTWWIFWSDGYQPLLLLDDNNDGKLSGTELAGLSLWRDVNSDGISQRGEVLPLTEWGIASLACRPTGTQGDVLSSAKGVIFSNGSSRPTYDWIARKVKSWSASPTIKREPVTTINPSAGVIPAARLRDSFTE